MKERRLWAIILAGGEGSRLVETTRRIYGWSDCGTPERLAAAFGDGPGPSQTVAPVWVAADVRA